MNNKKQFSQIFNTVPVIFYFLYTFRKITIVLVGLDNAGKTCTVKSIMRGKIIFSKIY